MAVEKTLIVRNELGLHLTSAAKIANTSLKFTSKIFLIKGDKIADAKSVLNITALMAPMGTELVVRAEGEDEQEALKALEKLFDDGFVEK